MNSEKVNSKIKLSNNSSFVILMFVILKFRKVGGQNSEQRNVERPVFRNFEIANIKITKDELFDNFIFELFFSFFRNYLNTQNI